MPTLPTFHKPRPYPNVTIRLQTLPEDEAPPSYRKDQKNNARLDIPQRIEKRLARLNASENIMKRWLVEAICWIVSAICMGVIIGILVYLRNGRLSKWPFGLTVITALAKVAAATLIIPTSEAIGQLKWNWFNGGTSKEMADFEIFDKASRGAWGSFMLLIRTKGKSLAAFGAVLTLMMLAIDTFFQQVVALPERWILQGNASIPMVTRYDPLYSQFYMDGMVQLQDDQTLVTATEMFFYDNGTQPIVAGNGTRPDIPVSCPTSSCTWPLYQTLGLCSACEDVAEMLTYACLDGSIDWVPNLYGSGFEDTYPNGTMCGYFLNATSGNPTLMSGYATSVNGSVTEEALVARLLPLVTNPTRDTLFDGSIHFKDIRNPIYDFIVVSAPNGYESVYRNETPIAKECVLSWCVKTINSSYYYGGYQEEEVSSFVNTTPGAYPWITFPTVQDGINGTDMYYMEENITISMPTKSDSSTTFGVSNMTMMGVIAVLDEMIPGWITVNATHQLLMRYSFYRRLPWTRDVRLNPWQPPNDITSHMRRLATAMTNMIRSTTENQEWIDGEAYNKEVYVSVEWGWLAFPLLLLVLSLLFLIATITKTAKEKGDVGVWKSSAIPTLIYSLPKDVQKEIAADGPAWTTAAQDGAKKTRIKLLPEKGWRVSGYSSAPTTPISRREAPLGWI